MEGHGHLPDLAMSRVEQDLRATMDEIQRTEDALKQDSTNGVLLRKYEALLRDRHILLEGRNDSISEIFMPAWSTLA